jgi:hypothetical protein
LTAHADVFVVVVRTVDREIVGARTQTVDGELTRRADARADAGTSYRAERLRRRRDAGEQERQLVEGAREGLRAERQRRDFFFGERAALSCIGSVDARANVRVFFGERGRGGGRRRSRRVRIRHALHGRRGGGDGGRVRRRRSCGNWRRGVERDGNGDHFARARDEETLAHFFRLETHSRNAYEIDAGREQPRVETPARVGSLRHDLIRLLIDDLDGCAHNQRARLAVRHRAFKRARHGVLRVRRGGETCQQQAEGERRVEHETRERRQARINVSNRSIDDHGVVSNKATGKIILTRERGN